MLLRICLIIAIVAGLGAGALTFLQIKDQITTLSGQRDTEKSAKETEISAHNKTKGELKKTSQELKDTQTELAETKDARDKAVAKADAVSKKLDDANAKITTITQQRDDAQNELTAYKSSGLTSQQVANLKKTLTDREATIATMTAENGVLNRKYTNIKQKYDILTGGQGKEITMRADLHGKILVVDPKWDFVVLDIGEDQGVQSDGELLVSRSGKLVAKVVVRSVQRDRCIANIIPGWKLGDPIEGDEVSPAHPAT